MKRGMYLFLFMLFFAQPCAAQQQYHIEVLQIGNTDVYDTAYEGLLDGLARQGLVKGYNLDISRTVLEMNPEPSLWEKITCSFRIRGMTSSVITGHPDLVVTLGTQATATFQDRIRDAGIPIVFSGVCPSGINSGNDMTGVVIRPQPADMIRTTVLALPNAGRLGIIHTSDPEAVAFTREMSQQAKRYGITVVDKEIDPAEPVAAAARELINGGVDAFIIPTDIYYEAGGWKASKDLIAETAVQRVPCISSLLNTTKGSLITLSPDFEAIGNLTAKQVSEILTQGKKPGELTVVSHTDQNFIVDLNTSRRLGILFRPKSNSLCTLN